MEQSMDNAEEGIVEEARFQDFLNQKKKSGELTKDARRMVMLAGARVKVAAAGECIPDDTTRPATFRLSNHAMKEALRKINPDILREYEEGWER